jgi:hypothetical protein
MQGPGHTPVNGSSAPRFTLVEGEEDERLVHGVPSHVPQVTFG